MTRAKPLLTSFYSPEQGMLPNDEGHRVQFYDTYRKVAEEYDKEFVKQHDEDLNTTLIFVSSASKVGERVLTQLPGRSIFCRRFRIHNRSRSSAPTRFRRPDCRSAPCPYLQDRQHHLRQRRSRSPTVDWSSPRDGPSSGHSLRKSRHLTFFCLLGHARQAMVKPLRSDRHAGIDH
jgi:hypothetical protein